MPGWESYKDLLKLAGETAFSAGGNAFFDMGSFGAQAVSDPLTWLQAFKDKEAAAEFAQRNAVRRSSLPQLDVSPRTDELLEGIKQPVKEGATQAWDWFSETAPEGSEALKQYVTDPRVLHTLQSSIFATPAFARGGAALRKADFMENLAKTPGNKQEGVVSFFDSNVDRIPVDNREVVSARFPTGITSKEDPLSSVLTLDRSVLTPKQLDRAADVFREYQMYGTLSDDTMKALDQVTALHGDNLLHILDLMPDEMKTRAVQWYEGANRIAQSRAKEFDVPQRSVSGAIAALSPQTDWDLNLARADRVLEIMAEKPKWNPTMAKRFDELEAEIKRPYEKKAFASARGKDFEDIDTDVGRAAFIRAYDEAMNPKEYYFNAPEGNPVGIAASGSGEAKPMNWGSYGEIAKAVSVIRDPSIENISKTLGKAHKIRNFFNNINAPDDPRFVTMDTHATAANMFQPYGGNAAPVAHNFGTTPNKNIPESQWWTDRELPNPNSSVLSGLSGTYPIHQEAYFKIADALGTIPRGVQSMTWEGIRRIFNNKSDALKKQAREVWKDADEGRISQQSAREIITAMAGGFDLPKWMQ